MATHRPGNKEQCSLGNTSRKDERAILAAEREKQACALRIKGVTYDVVAERMGLKSRASAKKMVGRAIRKIGREERETLQGIVFLRYEKLWAALEPAVEKGEVAAINSAKGVLDSLRTLFGLDEKVDLAQRGASTAPVVRLILDDGAGASDVEVPDDLAP